MRCFQPILEDCAKLNCFSRVAQRSLLTVLLCASLSQAAGGSSKVTFKVRVIANLIVMPGNVNNSRPLNIVLDSGASDNILVPELVYPESVYCRLGLQTSDNGPHLQSSVWRAFRIGRKRPAVECNEA